MSHDLTAAWTGPYGGIPPFDQVDVPALDRALRTAMAQHRQEIAAIRDAAAAATFDNTLAALEKAGRGLDRASTVYGVWVSTKSSPELRALEIALEPALAAHHDAILQDRALYDRVRAVSHDGLTPEQARLVWVVEHRFRRAGAELSPAARERVAAINQELSTLTTRFSQNLLSDEEGHVLFLTDSDLDGLPAETRAGAALAAEGLGHPGEFAIANTRSAVEPFLTFSTRRDLRERVWRTFSSRGEPDNTALITAILRLRAERALLLGYPTHAHLQLEDTMARTPDRAMALLTQVWPAATGRAREEAAQLQALAEAPLEPWDWRFYAEKVRLVAYELDQNTVRPYLELENLREGMFWAAGQLYGWQFQLVSGAPVPHPDVRVWGVRDADGTHRGLWYFDPFARPGKQSGAWMNNYRNQESVEGPVTPIVSNNENFVKGNPTLLSWDEAETLFHEFGHAMHGLASAVTYPTLSGTSVCRDFVEFPSQVNEHWLATREILERFAVHYQTGEPLPAALLARIEAARTFNEGFATTEYLASALVDLALHLAGDRPIDPVAFERDELARLGMPPAIAMRHRLHHFGHIFSDDGYSAAYYSYLWADTLTADAAEAFREAGGLYDRATAKRLYDTVLSVGNTVDPAQAWLAFRGREVAIEPWMRHKGFG